MARKNSIREKPRSYKPRRLANWLNPTGEKKVHSLIDKIYKQKNLELAWEKVKRNRGSGGIDGQQIEEYEENLRKNLKELQEELYSDIYKPEPVKQILIPKRGQPGKKRPLGIPTIKDRVCQQALLNRLEPIFEPIFDEASFGYRPGRSTKGAMRKIWKELKAGREWVVDADLKDFFGSIEHDKLMILLNQRISDGRVLCIIEAMLKAGCIADRKRLETEAGVPQGSVISPLMSNVLLTPFDKEMRRKGYRHTRFADDWLATCRTKAEAQAALRFATKVLKNLGVNLHENKTRIVHVKQGFEFLGYKIKCGTKPMRLPSWKIKSRTKQGALYVYPKQSSLDHFRTQIKQRTKRKIPLSTTELIKEINPIIRGWGNYYCKANIRGLFNQLDRWIRRRIWSHDAKRWRNCGWKKLPDSKLCGELGLVKLIRLIPSLYPRQGRTL